MVAWYCSSGCMGGDKWGSLLGFMWVVWVHGGHVGRDTFLLFSCGFPCEFKSVCGNNLG